MKSMLNYHSQNPRDLKNYVNSTLPVLYKCNNKACLTAHLLTTWFTEYFKPTVEGYCSEKRFLLKYNCLLTTHLSPKSTDGDVQQDLCCFHAYKHHIQSEGYRSRSNSDFQVFLFKKYISYSYSCLR